MASMGLGLVLPAPAAVSAQTQLDFDVCNQHATAVAGTMQGA